jgi:hypothetical protein
MRRVLGILTVLIILAAFTNGHALPYSECNCGVVLNCCPELGRLDLGFSRTFEGTYHHGEPYDVLTIAPNGGLETWEQVGIRLRVRLVCSCNGLPLEGIPAQEIVLFSSSGCWCPGGNLAAQDTDADGWTEFHGTVRGGGCGQTLTLFVDGIAITTLPIRFNSPDAGMNCHVDASDLSTLAAALGQPDRYSICLDFNESGSIDASDLSYFANARGAQCP